MTTVVSSDDWLLFILCFILATLLVLLGPGKSFLIAAIIAILVYVVRREARVGYEDVMESNVPSSDESEQ